MTKMCPVCDKLINDGDMVLALCVSVYHVLPSRIAYAISSPQECLEVMHYDCGKDKARGN